jgi:cell wall assembly regulator SMI1
MHWLAISNSNNASFAVIQMTPVSMVTVGSLIVMSRDCAGCTVIAASVAGIVANSCIHLRKKASASSEQFCLTPR